MLKKIAITAIVIILCNNLFAQRPTTVEIKTKKIKKISIYEKQPDGEYSRKTEIYYDTNGYDTATYEDGLRSSYKSIEYNSKGKPEKIADYSQDGKEKGITSFTYKPDGSYTSTYTDAMFGMKDVYHYDKNEKLLQYNIPDGSIIKYVYNNKGLLTKKYSIPKNNGVKFSETYTYNSKNKLVLSKRTGEYADTYKYEYDTKNLLKKSELISDDYSGTSIYEYSY